MSSSLLNIGGTALAAAQGSLATVSHNIANANTPGYTRQQAQLATAGAMFTGAGFFGRGVEVTSVRRSYDQFLTAAVQSATSVSAADSTRASGLKALDALFADPEQGIGAGLDNLFAAAGDLANRPADASARLVFVARAGQLAERITGVGQQIAALAQEADGRLALDAAQANTQLATIARLNVRIAQGFAQGQPPNDLLDQRDAAIATLGGLLAVRPVQQEDGRVNLFTVDGAPLLVGDSAARLESAPDPADPSRHAVRMTLAGNALWLDEAGLGGGSLAGALRLRDQDLAAAGNEVGRIAQGVAAAFNRQQELGVDMNGDPGARLFAAPGPATQADSRNTGSGTLAARMDDPSKLVASDYELRYDGSAWQLTRLADGHTEPLAALPATFDGLQFETGGTPASGDRWRVRPFAAASTGLQAQQLAPRQVATGYAATVVAGAENRGGAFAAGFAVVGPVAAGALPVTITFNDPPTSFNVEGLAGNVPYTAGQRVPAAPADYDGWTITLSGAPAAGDTFTVQATRNPASDNRNALAFAALADAALLDGASLNAAHAALLGEVGMRTQAGQASADISAQLQSEAQARQQGGAGVDLDEEAADLLRFQQAYQASARILQASQTLFQTLLSSIGG